MAKASVGEIVMRNKDAIEAAMDRTLEATRAFRSTLERDHPELVAGFNEVIDVWHKSRRALIDTLQEIVQNA